MPRDTAALLEVPVREEIAILDGMLEYFAKPGRFHKGGLTNVARNGVVVGRCVIGALRHVTGIADDDRLEGACANVFAALDKAVPVKGLDPADYNDEPRTTVEDIRRLISDARASFEQT